MDNMILLMSALLLVFMRGMQQQNVIHRYYWWAAATSYLIAIGEVAIVYNVAQIGWPAVPWIGSGGAIGITLSIYIHNKWIGKPKKLKWTTQTALPPDEME